MKIVDKNKKRQMIVNHRDQYEQTVADMEIQIEALKAQPHIADEDREELLTQSIQKKENAQAALDRMNEMLKELTQKKPLKAEK